MVALGVLLDLVERLAGSIGENLVQVFADALDLLSRNLDLGLLPLSAAARLVNHHHGIRQAEALALGAAREQHRRHGSGHAHADGGDVGLDEVHGVENGETGVHLAAGRVDVERDVLLGILTLQVQKLGDHEVRGHGVDLFAQKDDTVIQEAGIDVVAALAARGLLDDIGHERGIGSK